MGPATTSTPEVSLAEGAKSQEDGTTLMTMGMP
jgi:hypothetical protein